jgi:hypothetical protein
MSDSLPAEDTCTISPVRTQYRWPLLAWVMSSVVLVDPAGQAAHPGPDAPPPATGLTVPFGSFGEEGGPLDIGDPGVTADDAAVDGPALPPAWAGPAGDPDAHPVSTSPVSSAPAAAAAYCFTWPSSPAGPAMTFLSYQ